MRKLQVPKADNKMNDRSTGITRPQDGRPTYWLTRFLMLRLLGGIYAIAFLVAINQLLPLIGENGLLPLNLYLQRVTDTFGSAGAGFRRMPSIFWFIHSDAALQATAWTGFLLSCVVLAGFANSLILALLWILYMSIVHVGQEWYGYGWEIQLLETGFLAIFLCPLLDMRPFPGRPPPLLIIILFRWLAFRIMLGAGLIKLRGDDVWRSGTALYYHFETQPIPGPFSRFFHFLPPAVLKTGVWFNHLVELIAPWFAFWPRIGRYIAGALMILLQVILILSGNLSFLNWLTILPALACFDDACLSKLLPGKLVQMAAKAHDRAEPSEAMQVTTWAVTVIIALLSIQPVSNLLSPQQRMNASFDPLDLVNTYGAFGSVGSERFNVVFEGTMDERPDEQAKWKAYPYKGLPVSTDQSPPQVAPYQLRLDWQMWFAAMSTPGEYPWTLHLTWKLLHNDAGALGLFAGNPFPDKPPRYIRAILYRYSFAKPGNKEGRWWNRERVGIYWLPPLSADDPRLIGTLKMQRWIP